MASSDLFRPANLLFLIGGIYFAALAAAGEASVYVLGGAVICLISYSLAYPENFFLTSPWRVATSASVLLLLASQVIVDAYVPILSDYYTLASILVNGVLFVLFLGVLLYSAKDLVKKRERPEAEEVEKEEAPEVV